MKRAILTGLLITALLTGLSVAAATNAQAACQQYTATNTQHVSAGRAYTQSSGSGCNAVTTYYAAGSGENLGTSGSASTTLYTNDQGATYHIGTCPTETDADGDGYPGTTDCNDNDAAIHPGAVEVCGDGIDQDCDGADVPCSTTCSESTATNDGHVSAGRAYTQSSGSGCNAVITYYAKGSAENMGTSGSTSTTLYTQDGGTTYHIGTCPVVGTDADGDGYTDDVDCNDLNAAIHPGAAEICGDGIDQDCSGADLACGGTDSDGDGYPDTSDCNDDNPNIHPAAFDFCGDGIDQDCDGSDTTCLPAPSCISNLSNWKIKYAPNNANCTSCHTTCTPGGSSGRHSCTEGGAWSYSSCNGCHGTVH